MLDFKYLNKSVIALINSFDYKLHQSYFDYLAKGKECKNTIMQDLEQIFSEFDKHSKDLI